MGQVDGRGPCVACSPVPVAGCPGLPSARAGPAGPQGCRQPVRLDRHAGVRGSCAAGFPSRPGCTPSERGRPGRHVAGGGVPAPESASGSPFPGPGGH